MDMVVCYKRYNSKKNEWYWYPTSFLMAVATRIVEEVGFPNTSEEFKKVKDKILQILKEEYEKADAVSLNISEISLKNKEFNKEEWCVRVDYYEIRIFHEWNLGDCYLIDEIIIYPINYDLKSLDERLKEVESKLMGKRVPYLVKLTSFCDNEEEYCIGKFLEKNKNICDYEMAKIYKCENDDTNYTHEFVTENLPAILSFIRTEILPSIRVLQAPQIRDSKVIRLLNKPQYILVDFSVDDDRITIHTLLRSFEYFYAERI